MDAATDARPSSEDRGMPKTTAKPKARATLSVAGAAAALRSRQDLLESGANDRTIRERIESGELHRVRRGWYVDTATWESVWPESRHLLHVAAVAMSAANQPVFSFISAAVIWGLPLYSFTQGRVHIAMMLPVHMRSSPDVMRHEVMLRDDDVIERDGLLCTSLERTVLDLSAGLGLESGVASADAALRLVAMSGHVYDAERAQDWREQMVARAAASRARGIRTARNAIAFADGRAQLPGESVSRVQLHRLGFRNLELQVPVRGPADSTYYVDFGLEDVPAFGEFDGQGKYLDAALRGSLSVEETVLAEKHREDWIRGTSQRPLARWESRHIRRPQDLRARLAQFSIHPPF